MIDSSMRILFLSNFYPPHDIGGYEQWCSEVASGLTDRGHELAVLTSNLGMSNGAGIQEPTARDMTHDPVQDVTRSLHLQSDIAYYRPSDFFLRRRRQEQANQEALQRKIQEFGPDVIMVWGMWNLSHFLPYSAEQWLPGRVAYFVSNYWPTDVDAHTAYWQLPTRRLAAEGLKRPLRAAALAQLRREGYPPPLKFEHAVCCSRYVRDTLVAAGKLPPSAGVLLGGTDPQPFLAHSTLQRDAGPGPLRLLYFGRLIHDKGVHTALEALGLLKERGLAERVHLTMLGSGHPEYERKLRDMVEQLGLQQQTSFVSQVPREEIPAWLGRFDIFLFTSIWPEPMARSVMEAMAAGLLVIGTEVGGQTEMLDHGRNALTFAAEDAERLAGHITAMIGAPADMRRLARAGQEMVLEQFTLERMVVDIERYLGGIVGTVPAVETQPAHTFVAV